MPDLDEVTVVSCNVSYGFNITCTRQPLCVQPIVNEGHLGSTFGAPMVFNAPPTSVCALRSDDYNDIGHVVNNTVRWCSWRGRVIDHAIVQVTFKVGCRTPQMDYCGDVPPEIEFYTDLHCTPNAFIPGSGLQCQQLDVFIPNPYTC